MYSHPEYLEGFIGKKDPSNGIILVTSAPSLSRECKVAFTICGLTSLTKNDIL